MNHKKVNLSKLLSITFFATSIALLDFSDPGWAGNEKSYIGLVAGLFLLVFSIRTKK
jgi:hypothetical protein